MAESTVKVVWKRGPGEFRGGRYSRAHVWRFDGGAEVPASSSPAVVPPPLSDPRGVDPEEALVASLSSCHMLWFLALASKAGFEVESYEDDASGVLGRDDRGRTAMTEVTLRPRARFSGAKRPDGAALEDLHHRAHEACFIANSVRSEVRVLPQGDDSEE
jgi:organic hydroperoxide reductase OsmC/OhrA